ncbi:MAG: polysaccharide deacetylase family protein [Solirubrobacterales bacterium]|nr:polysaccharide deacetylase family protein [Solirubrobacterales bacterium]
MRRDSAVLAVAAGAVWLGPGLAVHCRPVAGALGVPLRQAQSSGVALTFDDGPHPEGTPAVLEVLAREAATATFFLVAEQVQRYPALVAEIAAAGHEAAVHGYRHRNQMRLLPRAFAADLERAIAVIGEVCGRAPRLYRPPYGVFTLAGLAAVRRASLHPLLWSKWGRDWRAHTTPREIAALATNGLRAGDVVLLHDADWYSHPGSHRRTAAALPAILAELRRLALPAVAVSLQSA